MCLRSSRLFIPKRSSGISCSHGIFSVGLGSCKNLHSQVVPDGKVPPVVWWEAGSDPQCCWGSFLDWVSGVGRGRR